MTAQASSLEQARPQASLVEAKPTAKPRLAYLDNLRMVLITSVVLGHLSVTYGADFSWYYYEGGEVSTVAYVLQVMATAIGVGSAWVCSL
jgi:peptidoglycan/LPS O-acetylase OafA/YrhL